ncbi:aminotransferase class III-fold pyridoxal phosphate-dependent enzyme [bacterium]|nr:aminotransferase class III-fold pyridoxal phosphate-dependent enzyme [bacterium]
MNYSISQLETWDKSYNWHPFTPMAAYLDGTPIIISKARGFFLVDQHGKEYIDGFSSLWCNIHGHQVPELDNALNEQLRKVAHSTFLGLSNEPATILAKKLVELAPAGLNRVFYSDSGATAVEVALKMAFQYWHQCPNPKKSKTKFLALGMAYPCEQEQVVPDFLCLAKGITGGYMPLAATMTNDEIFNAFLNEPGGEDKTFQHGHTYTANPLGAAVAIASLDLLIRENGVLAQVCAKGERLQKHLDRLRVFPFVGDIRRSGLMIGIELVANRETRQPFPVGVNPAHAICMIAGGYGLMIRPLGDVVVVMPPPAIPEEIVDRIGEVLYNCMMDFSTKISGQEG